MANFEFVGQCFFQNDVYMGSEYSFRMDLDVSRNFTYFTDYRQTRGAKKIPKTVLKTNNKGILSVFGRFIEDYLISLTCKEKSYNRFGLSARKLSKKL
jgi:hypothetical protein